MDGEATVRNMNTLLMVKVLSHCFQPGILKLPHAENILDRILILLPLGYVMMCLCTVAQWAH